MREIKFRAWHQGKMWTKPYGDEWLSEGTPLNETIQGMLDEGQALMQYTGLKDRKGQEIYEGDILALDMWHGNEHGYIPEDGIVKWHQPSSAFKWFSLKEDPSDGNNYWLSQADEHQREIISNIYENPELLEK